MKKFIAIIALVLIPLGISGQQTKQKNPVPLAKYNENVKLPLTTKERAQIIEVYGDSAEKLVFSNPHRLKSIKHILRNRVVVKLITDEGRKKPWPKLSEVTCFINSESDNDEPFNPESFNPLKYNFEFYSKSSATYHVDNTNYYIIIKSQYQ